MLGMNWKRAALSLAGLLACVAGCQFPELISRHSTSPEAPVDEDVSHLSDRQVADVKLSMARSLEQRGEHDRALEIYRDAREKDPKRATACWRMAILLDRRGNFVESEALYRQALKAEPKNSDIHTDFGYSLYLQKRWGEAEDQLKQAVALKDSNRRAHNNLGLLYAQTERTDEALAEFRRSGCQEAEARANLAFVLTLNRQLNEAHQQYELALEANPRSASAKAGLENLNNLIARMSQPDGKVTLAGYEQPAEAHPAKKGRQASTRPTGLPGHAVVPATSTAE